MNTEAQTEATQGDSPLVFPVRLLQVIKAADRDTGRVLDNVLVVQREHKVQTVATNGHCLVMAEMVSELFPADREIQLLPEQVGSALKADKKGDIDLARDANHVTARLTNGLQIRALEPTTMYPPYRDLMRPDKKAEVTVEVSFKQLATMLTAMAACLESHDRVRLVIAPGNILRAVATDDVTTVHGLVCGEVIVRSADTPAPEADEGE